MNSFAANLNLSIPDLWEVRDVINKVKSVVLNYTEMEAKVHEATNNEAWGASSTLMQEIAQGTFNYEHFSEIMPTIYKRFTEKEAKQWRQIYKALVLLEYLVKNGSERVVDDARSHISVIKMLKNFHYVDDKGKDQGINVRNRAKELAALLGDVESIKAERKKAKKNRNKYTGVGSDGGMMYQSSSGVGSRFEGFGSSSMSSGGMQGFGSDDLYDDMNDISTTGRYDDDSDLPSASNASRRRSSGNSKKTATTAAAAATKSKPTTAKEMNLFDFDDEPVTNANNSKSNNNKNEDEWGDFAAGGVNGGDDDDEFDDFQSAPTTTNTAAPAKPAHPGPSSSTAKKTNDIFDLLGDDSFTTTSTPPQQMQTQSASNLMLAQAMSIDSLNLSPSPQPSHIPAKPTAPTSSAFNSAGPMTPISVATANSDNTNKSAAASTNTQSSSAASTANIGGIWSEGSKFLNLDSLTTPKAPKKQEQGPTINSLKNSSLNSSWNSWANSTSSSSATTPSQQPKQQQQQSKQQSLFDDLLL